MKIDNIFKKLEEIAPVALSDEYCKKYRMYDNSGIIIDCKREITGALFSLDLSQKAIDRANELGYNLIVTHHPAIYGGISRLSADDLIAKCLLGGISVISMHLNFDAAPEGIDYYLMKGLGGESAEIYEDVQGGGYGRVYDIQPEMFFELRERVCATFNTKRALFYGGNRKVSKIASFCGAGSSGEAIQFAKERGANVFASSDMKHHEISALLGMGINVIHLTHYSAENYGFNKIYTKLSSSLTLPSAYFADEDLL